MRVPSCDSTSGVYCAVLISSGSDGGISILQGSSGSSIGSDVLVQGGAVDSASAAQSMKALGFQTRKTPEAPA
jgi:hypothetical protein